jgi:hypothetical protein
MRDERLYFATLLANSSISFALGTVVAWQVYQLGLVVGGVVAEREPVWYPDRVAFTAAGSDAAWIGGVVLVLAVGWALASIYKGGSRYDATRLVVLWVTLHCFRQGLLPLAWVPFDDTGHASRALAATELPEPAVWVVGVLGVAGLLALGLVAAPALLRFAHEDLASKWRRIGFIGFVGIGAWIIGSLLVLPLFLPGSSAAAWDLLPWTGAFLVFTLVASPEPREIYVLREPPRLSVGALIVLAVLIALARVFLVGGLAVNL